MRLFGRFLKSELWNNSELIPFSFQSLVELTEGTQHVKCVYYNPSKPNKKH